MTATKQVVYSATCPPTTYSVMDGSPIAVEISQLTITPRGMSKEEIEKATDKIEKSMGLVKSLIEAGNPIFEHKELEKLKSGLIIVAGLATIIQGITKIIDKPDNPLLEPLGKMAENIQKLGDKISENFKELKLLVSEVDFFSRILSPTSNLMRFWRDCIKNPGPEAVGNFTRDYNKHSPLKLAYSFVAFLEQKTTNPLVMAMEADKEKSKSTFQKWATIYNRIFFNFLLLEAFATGLSIGTKDTDSLLDAQQTVANEIAKWREEYKISDMYFKLLIDWAEDLMGTTDKTNAEIADAAQKYLDSFLTPDSFYILVFDEAEWKTDYYYHCPNDKDQMVGVWNKKNRNLIIYRSKKGNEMPQWQYDNSQREVKACIWGKLKNTGDLENITKTQLVDKGYVRPDGLICLVDKSKNLEVRSANCFGHQWGPGWWERVDISEVQYSANTLVVGLP